MVSSYLLCTVRAKNLNLTDTIDLKVKTERSGDWLFLFSIILVSNIGASAKPKSSLVSRASPPEKPWGPGCTNAAWVTSSQIQGFYRFVLIKFSNFKTFHQERCVSLHHLKYLWFVRRTNEALTRQALNCCLVSPRNKHRNRKMSETRCHSSEHKRCISSGPIILSVELAPKSCCA